MSSPLTRNSAQELPDGDYSETPLKPGQYMLGGGFSPGGKCVVFESHPGMADDSETFIELSSNEFELDISPVSGQDQEINVKNKELESCIHELRSENGKLKTRVRELEGEVTKLKSNAGNMPVSSLYVQLHDSRKKVTELEKRNQQLESVNKGLKIRLSQKDAEESGGDANEAGKIPQPVKRTATLVRNVGIPIAQNVPSDLTKQQRGQSESMEAAKLDLAEKLVRKDGIIQELREQLEVSTNRVNQLETGIDELEADFGRRFRNHEDETTRKFESLLTSLMEIQSAKADLDQKASSMQSEIQELSKSYPNEMQELQSLKEERKQEVKELKEALDKKTKKLENAKKQMLSMSSECKKQHETIKELESTIKELESTKMPSMETQGLIPDGIPLEETSSKEIESMRERIAELESALLDQQQTNESLLRDQQEIRKTPFASPDAQGIPDTDQLVKENKDLRSELIEVSRKLVYLEEQNEALKDEIGNQSDFFGQCLSLEDELEANKRINRGLVDHLTRRKQRIESLQKEITDLRVLLSEKDNGLMFRKRAKDQKAIVSHHVEDIVEQGKKLEELENIVSGIQAERDELLQEKASLNKTMHSLIRENKSTTRALNKLRSEAPALKEQLGAAKAEITKLNARLKVETLTRSGTSSGSSMADEEVMSKLVASQISQAEMDERMTQLRKELHKSVARNMHLAAKATRLEKQLKRST